MLDPIEFNKKANNGTFISLTANCKVRYSGRAESVLDQGDRMIVIKSDNTILIHQPNGSNPVNYMKEATHKALKKGDHIELKSSNLSNKESLTITLYNIYSLNYHQLEDSQKLQLVGSEKDMSDMIYDKPELIDTDFKPLSREEHTKFGFIDVFGHDKENNLVIVECKRYTADFKAVEQLLRYVQKIKELKGTQKVRGILAAPKIAPNAETQLRQFGFEFRSVTPPAYLEEFNKSQKSLGDF